MQMRALAPWLCLAMLLGCVGCSGERVWLQLAGKWLGERFKTSIEQGGGGNNTPSGGRFPEADNITATGAMPGEGVDVRETEEGLEFLRSHMKGTEPMQDAELCHIHVRFRWTMLGAADGYKLDLWEKVGKQRLRIISIFLNDKEYIAQKGMRFGGKYCWQVSAYRSKQLVSVTDTMHFSVMHSWRVDAMIFRHDAVEYPPLLPQHNLYIFHEASGTLLNLAGKPIWAHPNPNTGTLWNLQRLPNGNFAYMRAHSATDSSLIFEEIRPNGDLVWQSPDSLDIDGKLQAVRYDRDFALLLNGHYIFVLQEKNNSRVVELTRKGKIKWQWNSDEYVSEMDPFDVLHRRNRHNINGIAPQGNNVYISLPVLRNIVVVNRLTNRLTRIIGEKMPANVPQSGSGLVAVPHTPVAWRRGLCFFDSGTGKEGDTLCIGISLVVPKRERHAVSEQYHHPFDGLPPFRLRHAFGGAFMPISETLYAAHEASTAASMLLHRQHGVLWACNHRQFVQNTWQQAAPNFRIHWVSTLFD